MDRFPKSFIINGLKIVLENNIFAFNGLFYKQIKGTAMGTKVAPTYASLDIGYMEEILIINIIMFHILGKISRRYICLRKR